MKKISFYTFLILSLSFIPVTAGNSSSLNASGLKEALNVGIKNTITKVSKTNGYFSDAAIKILLPEEAQKIVNNLKLILGGEKMVNDVVLRMNRAAEDAAKEATPIFVKAITGMSFSDATSILMGKNDAATTYLKKTTFSQLTAAFRPKIKTSLDKPLVGNISTNQSWKKLTTSYNKVAKSTVGKLYNMKAINTNLDQYVTEKALNGMFIKLAEEEKSIRTNPAARVTGLLKSVFGALD